MEPRATFIQDLAICDPVAAYGILMGVPRIPISMNCDGDLLVVRRSQQPVHEGDLDTTIAQRTWIDNIAVLASAAERLCRQHLQDAVRRDAEAAAGRVACA